MTGMIQHSSNLAGVPLEVNGDFRIDDTLSPTPPNPCTLARCFSSGPLIGVVVRRRDSQVINYRGVPQVKGGGGCYRGSNFKGKIGQRHPIEKFTRVSGASVDRRSSTGLPGWRRVSFSPNEIWMEFFRKHYGIIPSNPVACWVGVRQKRSHGGEVCPIIRRPTIKKPACASLVQHYRRRAPFLRRDASIALGALASFWLAVAIALAWRLFFVLFARGGTQSSSRLNCSCQFLAERFFRCAGDNGSRVHTAELFG